MFPVKIEMQEKEKKISHRFNQNITTTNPCAPELIPEIVRVKNQNHSDTVVECTTRNPEVFSSNPGVGKKPKISHKSNQKKTTTNPSAPDLNK